MYLNTSNIKQYVLTNTDMHAPFNVHTTDKVTMITVSGFLSI